MPSTNTVPKDPRQIAMMREEVLKVIDEEENKEKIKAAEKQNNDEKKEPQPKTPSNVAMPDKEDQQTKLNKISGKNIVKKNSLIKKAKKEIPPATPIEVKVISDFSPPLKISESEKKSEQARKENETKGDKIISKKTVGEIIKNAKNKTPSSAAMSSALIRFGLKMDKDKKMKPNMEIRSMPGKKMAWLSGAVSAFVLLTAAFLILTYYLPKNEGRITRSIARAIPFPAIIIDGEFVSYNQFLQEVDDVAVTLGKQKAKGIIAEMPYRKQIRKNIADSIIKKEIILMLAKKNNLAVSQEEIDNQINQIQQQMRPGESIEKTLLEIYGWNRKDFESRVLKSYLLTQKLSKKLFPNLDDEKEQKEALAKKISEERKKIKIYNFTTL